MTSEWHYSRDGETYGPVSSADLKRLAGIGELLRTDLLWKDGMADWKPANQFPKLFPEEEAASVIVVPEESAEDPLASLKFDAAPTGKKGVKAKTAASVTENLASFQVDVAAAGRKATGQVKSHARTAGKVAVLAAERAKISTVTLPIAYAELGEHCYRSRTHVEEFGELFDKLDATQAGIAESEKPAEAGGDTIAEKAKAWAEQGMKFAQLQAQGVQAKTLFVQLGKACFNRFGPEAGPEELVTRIQVLRDRLAKINAEIKSGVDQTGGAKGWLVYGGGALLSLLLVVAITASSLSRKERRVGDSRRPKAPVSTLANNSSRKPSAKRSKQIPQARPSSINTNKTEPASVASASAKTVTVQPGKPGSLAGDYLAMIQDENQRTCSEVLCSLERFVGNGSVVPIPGRSDVPLKTIAENRSGVISEGPTPDSSTYKWSWEQVGARVPLKRWLEVVGHTKASPLKMHEPGFDKWALEGFQVSYGHMGELVEVPYKCVDGTLYLIGSVNEMPGFGKILDPRFMLLVPSADAAKRAEGHKVKARFQLADTRPVLSQYEQGIAQGRLVAINASRIAAHSAEYRDEAAAKFWFETVPKFEESAKHSEFFRGYLHGMIEQWEKEGLPVLR